MRSIQRKFNKIVERNPLWSSYLCFAEAIRKRGFSSQTISRWFNKLVDKNDYDKKEKKGIVMHFVQISKRC